MNIDILTLFPQMFQGPFDDSILKRAIERKLVSIDIHNIRDFTHDKHRTVDDYVYGGGAGMVLKPEPVFEAVESLKANIKPEAGEPSVILLTPQGRLFSQQIAHLWKSLMLTGCWNIPNTHDRPFTGAGQCLKYCFRDIMLKSPGGAASSLSSVPGRGVPNYCIELS